MARTGAAGKPKRRRTRQTRRRAMPSMGTAQNLGRRCLDNIVDGRIEGPCPSKVSEAMVRRPSSSMSGRNSIGMLPFSSMVR